MALAQVATAITRVAEEIKESQRDARLPLNEQLGAVDILSLNFAKGNPTHVEVALRIKTRANTTVPAALLLGAQNLLEEILG